MDATTLLNCVLIFCARIGDVSLGTLRTVSIMHGRRGVSWVLGFFEVLIWVFAVAKVIANLNHPAYAVAYALGFATGNFVGLTIEQWLAFGRQAVRIFTRRGREMAELLRDSGLVVTVFEGHGRDGPLQQLFIETHRRTAESITEQARGIDPQCYYVVDDVRLASSVSRRSERGGWRAVLKRK